MDVDAALDLDQGPARQVGEVGPPLADGVEPELLFQRGTAQASQSSWKRLSSRLGGLVSWNILWVRVFIRAAFGLGQDLPPWFRFRR